MIVIIRWNDHLLVPKRLFIDILRFLWSIGIEPETASIEYQQSSYMGSSLGICLSLVVTLQLIGLYY